MKNIMKHKNLYLIISLVVLIPGFISLFTYGLKLSIDFTGGSLIVYEFQQNEIDLKDEIAKVFSEKELVAESITQNLEGTNLTVRTKPLSVEENETIKLGLEEKYEEIAFTQVSFETVGPAIGKETTQKAFTALGWATLGILLYITYVFRNIPKPYSSVRFGASAIIAMLHDAFLVLGIFSILGHFFGTEIDALFITAVLTVIGFSVHDSIVVFDRIRENLGKLPKNLNFEEIVNYSIVETLNRSLATSLTVVITLLALYLLGGSSIKTFVLAMLIGIVSGTYSSIFTASPILVIWEDFVGKRKK